MDEASEVVACMELAEKMPVAYLLRWLQGQGLTLEYDLVRDAFEKWVRNETP